MSFYATHDYAKKNDPQWRPFDLKTPISMSLYPFKQTNHDDNQAAQQHNG